MRTWRAWCLVASAAAWGLPAACQSVPATAGKGAAGPPCLDLDQGKLSPRLRWLQTERLRGALMHRAIVDKEFPSRNLRRVTEGVNSVSSAPVTLRGQHVLLIIPTPGKAVTITLKPAGGRGESADTVFALYSPSARLVEQGVVARGKTRTLAVRRPEAGDYVLLLNPSIAFDNATQIVVAGASLNVDGRGRAAYHSGGETSAGTPLQFHLLRDMKLAGMNTLMLDFRHLAFAQDKDLKDWTRRLYDWANFAATAGMRFIPAVDLGGSDAEVEGWGDSPPGLYIDPQPNLPIAPCPLQKTYWDRVLLCRGREVAKASLKQPAIVGYGIDPEMYSCWIYGHYMLTGTCFCDHCLQGFLEEKGLATDVLAKMPTAKERWEWLRSKDLAKDWDKFLEDETCKMATYVREELQAINPDLLFVVYVLDIGNWFCRGLARGLGTERVPVVNFCEGSYWAGFNERAGKCVEMFRNWGAHAIHGGGLYPGSHPPTKPGYLGATLYNFALQTGGYWIWPMDYFLSGWQSLHVYEGQPAQQADYWLTLRQANAAIDERMKRGDKYLGDYNTLSPHPIWNPEAKQTPPGVVWRSEPFYPLRFAAPARLYFGVPKRVQRFAVIAVAPGADNGGEIKLCEPGGQVRVSVKGELDEPQSMEVKEAIATGVWSLDLSAVAGSELRDVRLRVEGLLPYFSATPRGVLVPIEKPSSCVGWWRLNEGQGAVVADSSGPPAASGTVSGATWADGHSGKALSFAGGNQSVSIPGSYAVNHLSDFTIMAWVRLNRLPTPGNGGTLVNKGPESPVQHFWLWIGYPPDHSLHLEMGNEKHRYGFSFSSGRLAWELGRWYHVAATFSCQNGVSVGRIYRDGVLVGEATRNDTFDSGGYDLRLGSYGGMHTLNGTLDEVKLFDRALGSEEVQREARVEG